MSFVMLMQLVLLGVWVTKHGRTDAQPVAVLLVMALAGAGVLVWALPGEHQVLMPWLLLLMICPALAVWAIAARRLSSTQTHPPSSCERCKARAELVPLRLYKVTGLVIWMQFHAPLKHVCRACVRPEVTSVSAHNLLLGWWWIVAGLATPGLLILNALSGVRARSATEQDFDAQVAATLHEHADYIDALAATKDDDIVAEVISDRAGVSQDAVRRYLRNRRAAQLPAAIASSSPKPPRE